MWTLKGLPGKWTSVAVANAYLITTGRRMVGYSYVTMVIEWTPAKIIPWNSSK